VAQGGWRTTCLIFAALQIVIVLPIYLAVPRKLSSGVAAPAGAPAAERD
jgi:predicted MFS family arabinose efflux permease